MTFQQIDDSAHDDEKPLDVALLKDVEANYAAALQARTRSASCTFDLRDNPRWCCLNRGVCPILWHLSPGTNEVTIRVRGNPDAAASGSTLGVYILPLGMVSRFLPDNEEEVTVSGTSGTNTYTLTLDTSDYEGWVFIGVTFESDQGTAVQLTDTGTGKGYDVFESNASPWTSSYVWVNNTNSHYSSGHEVPCAAIQMVDSSASASPLTQPSQIIRVEVVASPASYRLWVHPPFLRSGFQEVNEGEWNSVEDYAEIIPLGSLDVRSIEITETGVSALPSLGGMTDTGRSTAATILHRLYARGEVLFREFTRVHHVGPTQYGDQEDGHFAGEMLAKTGHTQPHTDAWTTLRGFVVGGDSPYRLNSTAYARTHYTVALYFFLTHYDDDEGLRQRPHSIRMRLRLTDLDGTTDVVTGSAVTFGASGEGVASWAHLGIADAYRTPPPAHLGAFYVSGLSNSLERGTLRTHALRHGLHPASSIVTGTEEGWWYRATLTIRDDHADVRRALFLQVLGGGSSLDGRGEDRYDDWGGRHIHIPTITVISTPLASLAGVTPGTAV